MATLVAKSFAYALEDIPTHWLEEAFKRAIQNKTDDFPLTAAAVNKAYQDFLPELQARAATHSAKQEHLLRSGRGSLGVMTLIEWKQRHNLPDEWKLGEPYPPESDLYGKPVPLTAYQKHVFRCEKCKDAGWTRIPYYAVHGIGAVLMRCSCDQAGHPWDGS